MHPRWIKYVAFGLGWALLGFLLSLEIYLNGRAEQMRVEFFDVAIGQFGRVTMWAAQAPFIIQMWRKLPLHAGRWLGGLGFHLAMSVVVMATFYVGRMAAYGVFLTGFDDFGWRLLANFYGRNMIDIAYYWGVIGFAYSWQTYERYKNEELRAVQLESRLVETELKALREQLHPHFLFNTMNTVSVFVREGRNDEAVTLIARLCSLLRMTLDSSRTPEVTLRQELDFIDRYIEIQKARFPDRLTVAIDVAPEALEARIPNLLLQPLVENAIIHGVAPKPGAGCVEIRAFVADTTLHLEVKDDGPGLPGYTPRGKEGIGLSNTRERITKIYGAAGQLSLRSETGHGVTVEIILPLRT
jgi:signal transduction histidine kinase